MKSFLISAFYLASAVIIPSMAKDPGCEVVRYTTEIDINKGKLFKKVSVDIRVNNQSGDKHAWISIPYQEKSKPKVNGWIEDEDGNIVRKLKKKDISEKSFISDFSFYEDDYLLKFVLKHNVYPYIIHYDYEVVYNEFVHISEWFPVWDPETPTRFAQLRLDTPPDYRIHIYSRKTENQQVDTLADKISYSWSASYEDPAEEEIFSPPVEETWPKVSIAPVNFTYGLPGSFETWETFGAWQFRINQGLNILPPSEIHQVQKLTRTLSDKKEIARTLYNYMQKHTRYVNVKLDIGGLKPYPAEYVSQNKYGDCKALTNYMKTLLEQVDIDSYYSIINAGENAGPINQQFPSQQFNHVILFVPLDKDTVWLECTSNSIPFGYLGSMTQDREALIVDKNDSHFVRTPAMALEDVAETLRANFYLEGPGASPFHFRYTFRGENYELLNYISTQLNETERERFLRENLSFPNFQLQGYLIREKDPASAELNLQLKGVAENYVRSYGSDLAFDILPAEIPPFERPEKRKLPVRIPYPINRIDTLIYHLPAGFKPANAIAEFSLESDFGSYSVRSWIAESALKVIRHFSLFRNEFSAGSYPSFYAFLEKVKETEKKNIILLKRQ